MLCSKCGTQLPDETAFCTNCGNAMKDEIKPAGTVAMPQGSVESLSLFGYYVKCLKNYVNFKGRARRKEYWGFVLFNVIIAFALNFLGGFIGAIVSGEQAGVIFGIGLYYLYCLAVFLPGCGACFRRLHDIGKSGWYLCIVFIPIVGAIIYLVWACSDSQAGENIYGPNPKDENVAATASATVPAQPAEKFVKPIIIIVVLALAIIGAAGGAGAFYFYSASKQLAEVSFPSPPNPTTPKPAEEVFKPTTATVTSNTLILYAERSPKSSNLKTLKKGEVIVVTGKNASGWTPAKSGNATGWVLSSSIAVKR